MTSMNVFDLGVTRDVLLLVDKGLTSLIFVLVYFLSAALHSSHLAHTCVFHNC